jgi:hypothetical protein
MLLTHDENQTLSQIKDYINNMQYRPDREMPLLHQFKRRAETDKQQTSYNFDFWTNPQKKENERTFNLQGLIFLVSLLWCALSTRLFVLVDF